MRALISGTGSYVPLRVMTNHEVAALAPTSDAWIRERLGIETRHIAAEDEQASDLAAHAARSALSMAGVGPNEIDGLICAVGIGDVPLPATASYVQAKLGIPARAFAFDLKAACAGSIAGIMMARGLIESGLARHVLVVGTALLSRTTVDWSDRTTAAIFGDAAGAALVSAHESAGANDRGIVASRLHNDSSLAALVGQYGGGSRAPFGPAVLEARSHLLTMDGRAVWECAVREVPQVVREVLELAGWSTDSVDFLVSHQANKKLLGEILARLEIPETKTLTNVERYGNTSSASMLVALDEAVRSGRITAGKRIVLCAIGAGMAWGAHALFW